MNILNILFDFFWSGIAALGFAMLFNVPKRTLLSCVIIGATGNTIRSILLQLGVDIGLATLAGSVTVGFMGIYFSDRLFAPPPVFTIPGVIPMIPGTFAYKTMIGILKISTSAGQINQDLINQTTVNAVKTAIILIALAVGIAIPNLLFQRKKPVV